MNQYEAEIGERFRSIRRNRRFTQSKLGEIIGISRNQIAAIEQGFTPLRHGVALDLCEGLNASLEWLANAEGTIDDSFLPMMFEGANLNESHRTSLFSEAFRILKPKSICFRSEEDFATEIWTDELELAKRGVRPRTTFESIQHWAYRRQQDTQFLSPEAEVDYDRFAHETLHARLEKDIRTGRAARIPRSKQTAPSKITTVSILKNTACKYSQFGNYKDMPSGGVDLPSLLESVRKLTSQRGKKKELAAWLGVPASRVTEWLSGVREPGGAVTLRLLDWVKSHGV